MAVTPAALPQAVMLVETRAEMLVAVALPEAGLEAVALLEVAMVAVTAVALATPATTKVSAMRVRARTGATSVVARTVVAMLVTEAAMAEVGATVAVMTAVQEELAILAMTAVWVVPGKARMAGTSVAAHKGVVMLAEEAMAARVAATAVEGSKRSEKLQDSGACRPRLLS